MCNHRSADEVNMPGDGDILELGGQRVNINADAQSESSAERNESRGRFLSVWFRCCHVYGRMQRNREQTQYEGRCPKCGAAVKALIGAEGTSQRMFEAG